jgi:hypothetical protein
MQSAVPNVTPRFPISSRHEGLDGGSMRRSSSNL